MGYMVFHGIIFNLFQKRESRCESPNPYCGFMITHNAILICLL